MLVETALVLLLVKYRSRGRPRSVEGPQILGATRLELLWTVVPVLILAAIAGFVFYKLPGISDVPPASAGERLPVRVDGRQFSWTFTYPDGQVSVDRMVVPVNRVVTLDLHSTDVVHSWWVPQLGGKTDTIPGRTTHTWFQARRTGTYDVRCAELCGLEHAHMTGVVEVVDEATFERFLASHQPSNPATVGRETFDGSCAKCHGLAGEGDYGPPLEGSATLLDAQSMKTLIREGQNRMPAVGKGWSDEQVAATIAYLKGRFAPKGGASGGG